MKNACLKNACLKNACLKNACVKNACVKNTCLEEGRHGAKPFPQAPSRAELSAQAPAAARAVGRIGLSYGQAVSRSTGHGLSRKPQISGS